MTPNLRRQCLVSKNIAGVVGLELELVRGIHCRSAHRLSTELSMKFYSHLLSEPSNGFDDVEANIIGLC